MSCVASLCLAALLLTQPPIAIDLDRDRDVLTVSFNLLSPLPESIEAALPTGALVRVRYPLRIRVPRKLWWDRKIWKGEVLATAAFDPVTGRYRCELVLDGIIIRSSESDSAAAARDFLTHPGPVRLSLPPIKRSELRVRVRAVYWSGTKWLLFPSAEGTPWIEVPVDRSEPDADEQSVPLETPG